MNQLTSLPTQHPTSKVAFSLRVKFTVLSLPCSTLGGLCSSHKKTCQVLPYFLLGASSLHSTPHALLLSFKHIEHIPTSGPLHLLCPTWNPPLSITTGCFSHFLLSLFKYRHSREATYRKEHMHPSYHSLSFFPFIFLTPDVLYSYFLASSFLRILVP